VRDLLTMPDTRYASHTVSDVSAPSHWRIQKGKGGGGGRVPIGLNFFQQVAFSRIKGLKYVLFHA